MLSLRTRHLAFLCLFQCLLLALVPVQAVPLDRRQAQATTVTTSSTTSTPSGDMQQTCVITLTPITDNNGNPAFEEVRQCTVTMNGQNNGSSGNGSSTDASSTDSSNSSTDSSNSSTDSSNSSTDSSSTSTTSTDTSGSNASTTDSSAASSTGGAVIDNGVSSIAASAVTTSAAATATSVAAVPGSAAPQGVPAVSDSGLTSVPASAAAASAPTTTPPTAAAENAASSASSSAFVVPGRSLQVLPIGLGVFAGISVIALIVVGLVTYERTKYRKAFRARKLAESGAGMGYGGMAQR